MKKLILIASLFIAVALNAQTTNTPPTTFFETAQLYFTSFNTNLNWITQRGSFEAGVDSISKTETHLANSLRLSYDVWKNLDVETTVRDSGVAGTWVSAGAGVGYSAKVFDTKLTLSVQGGREFIEEKWMGEISIQASKKFTAFTHAFVRLGARLPNGSQIFSAGLGFSF